MRGALFFAVLLLAAQLVWGQGRDEREVRGLLTEQAKAWNRGDVEGYMQTYWKSDSLLFIGKSGVHRGWEETLANYKKGYPDTAAMGRLSFELIEVRRLSPEYFYVVGKWMLDRSIGNLSGHFDLLIRRIRGHWKIVSDHSS